jgi:formate hydrogenlyase subunit 4
MVEPVNFLSFALLVLIGPPLILGILRKVKARLQNRIGSPIWQPLFDLTKLLKKDETISDTASWLFRFAVAFNLAAGLYLAMVMPWLTPKPELGNADLFLVLYLLAAMRFFTLLASLDTGSAFGGFAASIFLIKQHGLKRLFAYSSIENVGLMLAAIGLGIGPPLFCAGSQS